ncbi:MAG: glycerol-3-phosphate 1-O-acyltransferase PlsY [Chloroflexota bacterium]|nr:glycerol-3-phosphate 1-O-acyltransferase PlsY [Chloroflexota bacterium]MDE2844616.1 glycerol-3-phosphate 1-O-acyltransferase PlsY [Chloroflexota bacterium]
MKGYLTPSALSSLLAVPALIAASVAALLTLSEAPTLYRYAAVLPLAYIMGALPWGYVVLLMHRGIDIRDYGSGRTGVSNALRTAGYRPAGIVLALDLVKGISAVMLARTLIGDPTSEVAAGLAALVGHNWPVFLGFRGGRGIAPGLGGLAVMSPIAAVCGVVVFLPVCVFTRYLSLGSIMGVVSACGVLVVLILLNFNPWGLVSNLYLIYGLLGGTVIVWQHRDNIQRLLAGTERRIGNPAARIEE